MQDDSDRAQKGSVCLSFRAPQLVQYWLHELSVCLSVCLSVIHSQQACNSVLSVNANPASGPQAPAPLNRYMCLCTGLWAIRAFAGVSIHRELKVVPGPLISREPLLYRRTRSPAKSI